MVSGRPHPQPRLRGVCPLVGAPREDSLGLFLPGGHDVRTSRSLPGGCRPPPPWSPPARPQVPVTYGPLEWPARSTPLPHPALGRGPRSRPFGEGAKLLAAPARPVGSLTASPVLSLGGKTTRVGGGGLRGPGTFGALAPPRARRFPGRAPYAQRLQRTRASLGPT